MERADSIDSAITGSTGDRHMLKAGFSKQSLTESFKSIGRERADNLKDANTMWHKFLFFRCGLIRNLTGACCFRSGPSSVPLNGFEDVQGIK